MIYHRLWHQARKVQEGQSSTIPIRLKAVTLRWRTMAINVNDALQGRPRQRPDRLQQPEPCATSKIRLPQAGLPD
jgi:hypothetical protein